MKNDDDYYIYEVFQKTIMACFFDNNGNKTVWGSYGGVGDDFDLSDYVEIGALHTYFMLQATGDKALARRHYEAGRKVGGPEDKSMEESFK